VRVSAEYRPWLATSGDETRVHLVDVHFDVERKELQATNGHIAVIIPCEPAPEDVSGPIPCAVFDFLRASDPSDPWFTMKCGERVEVKGASFDRAKGIAFPPLHASESVFPSYKSGDAGTVTFGLNAEYLLRVAHALGQGKPKTNRHAVVHLTVKLPTEGTDMLCPVLVAGEGRPGCHAAVMPCRL